MKKRAIAALLLILTALTACGGMGQDASQLMPDQTHEESMYAQAENWAYLGDEQVGAADVFFIAPTVYIGGEEEPANMSMEDAETKANFLGAINMEKGIYEKDCRFFAPYYRQASLTDYLLPEEELEEHLSVAYEDVRDAFSYYLVHYNDGQPIILAGFSQGADMSLRLMKEFFADEALSDKLVACYAIGWRITEQEMDENPHLRFASGEDDTGVIIAFNSEAENITQSTMIPAGVRTLAINPLNWKTDGTPASKEENQGACFTDYEGNILLEVPQLTGAYIDQERGALKVPDVSPDTYPPVIDTFEAGVYHVYDYQFFYRNLQENVGVRLAAYMTAHAQDAAA